MYITISGDTWDIIALKVYGDEKYVGFLMENNTSQINTFIFSEGVALNTPILESTVEESLNLPEWRK